MNTFLPTLLTFGVLVIAESSMTIGSFKTTGSSTTIGLSVKIGSSSLISMTSFLRGLRSELEYI
jgi:hypothetical protein